MSVQAMRNVYVVNTRNRILSQHIRMSMNTRHTDLNNNILVIGGSGSGKTFRFVKPQLMQMFGSYIITDPKGELYRDTSAFLKQNGYEIKVLNLLDEEQMVKSSHFNPFSYVRSEVDILKLITNLIKNTTPEGATSNDPFWERAEGMGLQALFYYVWLEGVPEHIWEYKRPNGEDDRERILAAIHDPAIPKVHNVRGVMELLKFAEFKEDPRTGEKLESTLDIIMNDLELRSPNHKAVLNYNKVMRGAADTVRSVIISMNARLASVETEAILSILDDDEMDIELIGTRKTAIYCVIPDNDPTYNFLVGMMYNIMFQRLYYEADFVHGGSLPVPVTFLLDEFDNVALPENFLSLLSTMRSRNISSVIIIQDLSQIKTRYKDGAHQKLLANCDTWVYLGGNGPDTQKELSELMGKATIDKRTNGETLGKQGSSSRNYDIVGRELMFPDELRKIEGNICIMFIRGFDPIMDQKIESTKHPCWEQMCEAAKGELFDARVERLRRRRFGKMRTKTGFVDQAELLHMQLRDQKEMTHYKNEAKIADLLGEEAPPKPINHIFQLTLEELGALVDKLDENPDQIMSLDDELLRHTRDEIEAELQEEEIKRKEDAKLHVNVNDLKTPEMAITYAKLKKAGFGEPQIKCILQLAEKKTMTTEEILGMFDREMDRHTVELLVEYMS